MNEVEKEADRLNEPHLEGGVWSSIWLLRKRPPAKNAWKMSVK